MSSCLLDRFSIFSNTVIMDSERRSSSSDSLSVRAKHITPYFCMLYRVSCLCCFAISASYFRSSSSSSSILRFFSVGFLFRFAFFLLRYSLAFSFSSSSPSDYSYIPCFDACRAHVLVYHSILLRKCLIPSSSIPSAIM